MKKLLAYSAPIIFMGVLIFASLLSTPHYGARLPVTFIPYTNQPKVDVSIEGNIYPLMIDLGDSSSLTLKTKVLDQIKKKPLGSAFSFDVKGNQYKLKTHLIPKIRIRNMVISNVEVLEEADHFFSKGSLLYDNTGRTDSEINQNKLGRIGRGLFIDINANLLLDFHNSVIYACCHVNDRRKDGYRMNRCVSAPFELSKTEGVVLTIDTDQGTKRFMLDTGATKTILNSTIAENPDAKECMPGVYQCESKKFVFGGRNFGEMSFLITKLKSYFKNLDGIIGMDFLKNHTVFIDFENKMIFIGKSEDCFKPKIPKNSILKNKTHIQLLFY